MSISIFELIDEEIKFLNKQKSEIIKKTKRESRQKIKFNELFVGDEFRDKLDNKNERLL